MKQLLGHLRLTRRVLPVKMAGWSGFLLLLLAVALRGADLPAPITLDVPIPPNLALPTWLGQPEVPATTFATLNLPILTPDPAASLLVTVYFQEKQDGFMRISWQGTQGAQVLSDNFYENIGMANQRSLLISPSMLIGDGTLTFQCGDSTLGIERIKLEWLESKSGLVSPNVRDSLVTPSSGLTVPALSLNGQTLATAPGAWQDQLVNVPLTDSPVRIEQGVDFSIDLDKVPGSARVALEETGLPLGKHLIVWINEQRAGTITPTVPDLLDAGFLADANATTNYVGWRDGSFFVPVAILKSGINTLQFSTEDDAGDTPASTTAQDPPLAIKALVMQLNYAAAPLTSAAAPASTAPSFLLPQPSLAPTGPIAPADTSSTPSETSSP